MDRQLDTKTLKDELQKYEIEVSMNQSNLEIKVNHAGKENISLDSISKTGKIVNAYNALIAASKSKRK